MMYPHHCRAMGNMGLKIWVFEVKRPAGSSNSRQEIDVALKMFAGKPSLNFQRMHALYAEEDCVSPSISKDSERCSRN